MNKVMMEKNLVSKVKFEGNEYIYLADISNFENYIFGRLEGNKITKVTNLNLLSKLILLFSKKN
jgi:hypothetical protein